MRDRNRILLIIPFIILGFILGYISSSTYGLKLILAALAIAIPLLIIADLLSVVRSVMRFGEAQFTVGMQIKNQLNSVFFVLLIFSAALLIVFLIYPHMFILPFLLFLCLTVRYGVRNRISNNINKCGVLYWGTHHKWADITGYHLQSLEGNTRIIVFAKERIAGFTLDRKMYIVVGTDAALELEEFIKERISTFNS